VQDHVATEEYRTHPGVHGATSVVFGNPASSSVARAPWLCVPRSPWVCLSRTGGVAAGDGACRRARTLPLWPERCQ
jgi:hypothetical protein